MHLDMTLTQLSKGTKDTERLIRIFNSSLGLVNNTEVPRYMILNNINNITF